MIVLLVGRRLQVVGRRSDRPRAGRFAEAELLHAVEQFDGLAPAQQLVAVGDDAAQVLARTGPDRRTPSSRLEDVVEDAPGRPWWSTRPFGLRGIPRRATLSFSNAHFADDLLLDRQAHLDAGMDAELLLRRTPGTPRPGLANDHALALEVVGRSSR